MSKQEPVDQGVVDKTLEIAASIARKYAEEVPSDGGLKFLYARAVAGAIGHLTALFINGLAGDSIARLEVRVMAERGLVLLDTAVREQNTTTDVEKPEVDHG